MLGIAEAMILLVSIYLGVTLQILDLHGRGSLVVASGNAPVSLMALTFAAVMFVAMMAMGLYQRDLRDRPAGILIRLALSFTLGLLLMTIVFHFFPQIFVGNNAFAVALACAFVGIASCRFLSYQYTDSRLSRRVLVLGAGEKALHIQNLRRRSDHSGVSIVGYVGVANGSRLIDPSKLLKVETSLYDLVRANRIDEIVVALDDRRRNLPVDDILLCKMNGISIIEDTTFYERQLGKITLDSLRPSNVFYSDGFSQAVLRASSKRLFDIVVSGFMLIATLPIMLLTAAAILLESGGRGTIIYRQERVGRNGRPFDVYKFRSMREDAERDGEAQWARSNDERVTRVGRFIRKSRIDELPQLYNVLNGDMSFVGPRPERPQFVAELQEQIPYYALRHHVKPGITGWAQICYPYGASVVDAKEKLQYDLYYLKNYSVFLDLTILFQTAQVILWGKGSR
jgi:sugar transferase (PEP-CTERM system associated)